MRGDEVEGRNDAKLLITILLAERTIVMLNTALLFKYTHDEKIEEEVEKALTEIEDAKVAFMD
jgi:hypothetical protein